MPARRGELFSAPLTAYTEELPVKTLNRLFGGGKGDNPSPLPIVDEDAEALWEKAIAETELEEQGAVESVLAGERRVIQAPVLQSDSFPEPSESIGIVAEPALSGDQCVFKVNRSLMEKCSWYFGESGEGAGSPLVEALFALGEVETVLVCESSVTVTSREGVLMDWEPLAKKVGGALRSVLGAGGDLISAEILEKIPGEEEIKAGIQRVIEEVVNPGVAGHGGNVSIVGVWGNSVSIKMGGGCQGCSAADMTLKQGIHRSFREGVPGVGAIFDETEHSAGLNPYFA